MAHFFKAEGMSGAGYDRELTKQSVVRDQAALIALYGGDTDGSPLVVWSNNPGVIDIAEQAPSSATVRVLRLTGRKPGYTMVEAKNRGGQVWAFLQVQVSGGAGLSRDQRVAEAIRRSLPLLPAEIRDAAEG